MRTVFALLVLSFAGCSFSTPANPDKVAAFERHMSECLECKIPAPDGGPSVLCEEGFRLLKDSIPVAR